MKYLVLLGDGMADYPLPQLGGRTPLEIASTPTWIAWQRRVFRSCRYDSEGDDSGQRYRQSYHLGV